MKLPKGLEVNKTYYVDKVDTETLDILHGFLKSICDDQEVVDGAFYIDITLSWVCIRYYLFDEFEWHGMTVYEHRLDDYGDFLSEVKVIYNYEHDDGL